MPDIVTRLCHAARINGVTPHVFRHTFASIAGELGYSELTIAGLLGHGKRGVTQGYIHIDELLRSAADTVSAKISAILDGKEQQIAKRRKSVPKPQVQPAARSSATGAVDDNMLLATLAAQFANGGIDADQLRAAIGRIAA